ncbi:MAG: SDR family NAD(P)-dependent oxidoreductase [Chitinivibrionales bacterium]|nr:SDR family NAD(P)-dependent oxidoreductase [Chitinivibrionales bacterium]
MAALTDLTNSVALITGASRGIGKSVASVLAHCGALVYIGARSLDELRNVEHGLTANGCRAASVKLDVSDESSVGACFRRIESEQGKLDVLINNAGIGSFGELAQLSLEEFDHTMAVNLRGTFLCCRRAMQMMVAHKSGYIINMSSVVGFKGYPRQSAYAASKHAIMGLTKSLSVEAQPHNIRVSAVLPGGVDTDMVTRARPDLDRPALLRPEDVAQAVLYLLSLSEYAAVDQIYLRRRNSAPF